MEISLRKPQREIFNLHKINSGSFFRTHKKSASSSRLYYRLMTFDYHPIKNFPYGKMKPLFSLDLLDRVGAGEFCIKRNVVLLEKKAKLKK